MIHQQSDRLQSKCIQIGTLLFIPCTQCSLMATDRKASRKTQSQKENPRSHFLSLFAASLRLIRCADKHFNFPNKKTKKKTCMQDSPCIRCHEIVMRLQTQQIKRNDLIIVAQVIVCLFSLGPESFEFSGSNPAEARVQNQQGRGGKIADRNRRFFSQLVSQWQLIKSSTGLVYNGDGDSAVRPPPPSPHGSTGTSSTPGGSPMAARGA